MEPRGARTEALIRDLCTRAYFSDFIISNPKYVKEGGQEKEAADLLIPFQDRLLVLQIKSKEEVKPAEEKDEVDEGRIEKRLKAGIAQMKAIKEAIAGKLLANVQTVRGIQIPFDCTYFKSFVGVVILDLIGEERLSTEKRTAILNGFSMEIGFPVHLFMREDFEAIVQECDTLPDLLLYLDDRAKLRERGALSPVTEEKDYLAVYKTMQPTIQKALKGELGFLHIDSGIWAQFQSKDEAHEKRAALNKPSKIIDRIIEALHSTIGFDSSGLKPDWTRKHDPAGTVESYWHIIRMMASWPRIYRREIGAKFIEKMQKADREGQGWSLSLPTAALAPNTGKPPLEGVVVFSTNADRKTRVDRLGTLATAAYCKFKLTRVLGIATEPWSVKERSFDYAYLDGVTFENADELAEQASRFFGPAEYKRSEEWKSTTSRPLKPKPPPTSSS